jgi:hypothetical protein
VKGNGYGYFFVAMFNFQKSMHMCNLLFFFGTATIGDSQVACSTYSMKLATNNLSRFCFTIVA